MAIRMVAKVNCDRTVIRLDRVSSCDGGRKTTGNDFGASLEETLEGYVDICGSPFQGGRAALGSRLGILSLQLSAFKGHVHFEHIELSFFV